MRNKNLKRAGDIKKDIAKLPLMERTGWWFKIGAATLLARRGD